jgi:hypothetical protein
MSRSRCLHRMCTVPEAPGISLSLCRCELFHCRLCFQPQAFTLLSAASSAPSAFELKHQPGVATWQQFHCWRVLQSVDPLLLT